MISYFSGSSIEHEVYGRQYRVAAQTSKKDIFLVTFIVVKKNQIDHRDL